MSKYLLIIVHCSTVLCYGQNHVQYVEDKISLKNNTYYNDSLLNNESAATDYIGFYQKYISGIRGPECPMYPSCSNFGLKAFKETNFITGLVLTSDRLLRCGSDRKFYSLTLRQNGIKLLDYPAYDTPPKELYYPAKSSYSIFSDTINYDSTFVFIKKLINYGFYHEALLEIMRIEFQTTFNEELFTCKLICLRNIGEFEKGLFEYEKNCPENQKQNPEILLQIAQIDYMQKYFTKALTKDTVALMSCFDMNIKAQLISLNGLIYANMNEWSKSLDSYKNLSYFESYKKKSELNSMLVESAIMLKVKNPTFASIISIIPGAGYAYVGHTQTALSALLFNGLLAFATYSNIKSKNYGMGILTGVFNLSFYIGNIYGANKSAHRYNEKQKGLIINQMELNSK